MSLFLEIVNPLVIFFTSSLARRMENEVVDRVNWKLSKESFADTLKFLSDLVT